MRVLLLALLLLLSACASGGRRGYDPNAVRMCIQNETVGYGNVVAYVNTMRFTVAPGEEECRNVSGSAAGLTIRASTTAGGMGCSRAAWGDRCGSLSPSPEAPTAGTGG